MRREYHRWFSPNLSRDMELLRFGDAGSAIIVFPTRQGRFFDYENWGLVGAISDQIDGGRLTLYCIDSIDSEGLYCRSRKPRERLERQLHYEQYILAEVVPFARSGESHARLALHGCSIGAYHAVTTALRHPDYFCQVVGLSGRYDLTRRIGPFADLFDGYYDEDVYFYTPSHFIANLADAEILDKLRRLQIVLAVGEADPFRDNTRELSEALWRRGIPNRFDVWSGEAHQARDWQAMIRRYL